MLVVIEAIIEGIDLGGGLFRRPFRGRFVGGVVAVVVIRRRRISGWMIVGIVGDSGRLSGSSGQVDAERIKGRG